MPRTLSTQTPGRGNHRQRHRQAHRAERHAARLKPRDRMATEISQALVKVRIHQWRGVRSGWLIVDPTKLVVYRSRLFARPEEAASFENNRLKAGEPDAAKNGTLVTFDGPDGEATTESFSFSSATDAQSVSAVLSRLLKEAEEEKKRREEEAARQAREQED